MPTLSLPHRREATAAPPPERVLTFGDVFGRDAGGLIVLLVLFGAMTMASDEFLSGDNRANLARQVAIFGIIAVGQLLVILTAGIDLSVGSVLGLTGCVTAQLLTGGMPIPVAITSFVLRRTVFGRYIYAVGSNPESARLAGVPVNRVLISVYAIAGLLAAVGGVLFASRLNAGIPTAGTGYELNAIAACVIGGGGPFGG